MRISDWSSDVCASDLEVSAPCAAGDRRWRLPGRAPWPPRSGDTRGSAMDTIRNPIEWSMDALREAGSAVETASGATLHGDGRTATLPTIRRIAHADLQIALRRGIQAFADYRTAVMFICIIYPMVRVALIFAA